MNIWHFIKILAAFVVIIGFSVVGYFVVNYFEQSAKELNGASVPAHIAK